MTATRRVVQCFMAHPDDAEFMAAGTLALLAAKGWEVHIVSATPGDCETTHFSPEAIAKQRRLEGHAAAQIIGAQYHCLELRDLYVHYCDDSLRKILQLTRAIAPTLMITHALNDYMPDHEETARLARTASIGFFVPNACGGPITPGVGVPHLYYADPIGLTTSLGKPSPPDVIVDISSTLATKLRMLQQHASQREWLKAHYGNDEYTQSMLEWSRQRGQLIGTKSGEGFHQHKGYGYPTDCILNQELGSLVHRIP